MLKTFLSSEKFFKQNKDENKSTCSIAVTSNDYSSITSFEDIKRKKSNKFQRAKDGRFQVKNLPLGYKRDSKGNTIIAEPNALIAKNIFTMYEETKRLSKISKRIDKNISSIL